MRSAKQVKDGPDIVKAIGALIDLREVGKCYIGYCPWHWEETPSLVVDPKAETWHCFGCEEGADVHDFCGKIFNIPREKLVQLWRELMG